MMQTNQANHKSLVNVTHETTELHPTNEISPLAMTLDFEKLKWKLTKSSEATWTEALCEFAEIEYKKFLTLKMLYPKVSLVPSKLIDKFWHEHILDTKSYAADCDKLFGHFIHHYPYFGIYGDDDQQSLQTSFERTIALYENHFGKYPTDELYSNKVIEAARCEDHACHVPSTCACRTPNACK
ncbi:glycine-rich domain-containing protein [Pseudoalteromonas pernae]|uniref:glycine-rich domain-containing protein n=1 Tax=Pseudoalteromonas pernae TaxID=3118054 RepID=UPI003242D331